MSDIVQGQRVMLDSGMTGRVSRIWPGGVVAVGTDCGGIAETRVERLTAIEPAWRGRLWHCGWRVRFGLHMLAEALRWWRKPWQTPTTDDPRDDMSLRTALEVAWIVWR